MEDLAQVQCDVDLIVLRATGQGWALPPALRAIDGVARRVCLVAVGSYTDVTVLALDCLVGISAGHRTPNQLAVEVLSGA